MKDGDAFLSCFGLMKEFKDDQRATGNQFVLFYSVCYYYQNMMYVVLVGSMNSESLIFRFGTLLVNLLSGKQIPPSHVSDSVQV